MRLADLAPMVRTGFSEVIGSWKIIEISLPRIVAHLGLARAARDRVPSILIEPPTMRPGGLGTRRSSDKRRHRLAAAGLADDRQRLAAAHRERHVVDRFDDARRGEQIGLQALDLEHVLGIGRERSPCSRRFVSVAIAT